MLLHATKLPIAKKALKFLKLFLYVYASLKEYTWQRLKTMAVLSDSPHFSKKYREISRNRCKTIFLGKACLDVVVLEEDVMGTLRLRGKLHLQDLEPVLASAQLHHCG
jgi:hypothetical protein